MSWQCSGFMVPHRQACSRQRFRELSGWAQATMIRQLVASFLAEILLLSAVYKFRRPVRYRDALNSYTALRHRSHLLRMTSQLAWGLPALEAAVAICLFFRPLQLMGAVASTVLFATSILCWAEMTALGSPIADVGAVSP